ncbi:glycosyltransferase family 2 protein [Roseovarius sp. SYSU LYC5161]|uniref:glycosyltransferase family 2 protein n=1 Tax=Roseovarius halophilus (ex Wu et al. 2025) TaxID=3376060 RepID=UPI003999E059
MSAQVSAVIPARNEAATIGRVVATLQRLEAVAEVIVVDNGSDDATLQAAGAAGARTLHEPVPGMGHALKAGFAAARQDWILKIDADLDRVDIGRIARLLDARAPDVGLIKGAWHDPADDMPMTRLLVKPAIRQLAPALAWLAAPNSGIYAFRRGCIAHEELTGDYAVDLDVMLRVHAAGARISEVDIGRIVHDARSRDHYSAMADTIMAFFMQVHERRLTDETVILADHADDVVENALGLAADRASAGAAVTIFLGESHGAAADVLRTALSRFPTARVAAMSETGHFQPRPTSRRLSLISPYPSVDARVTLAALRMADRTGSALSPRLLLMPSAHGGGEALNWFTPDTVLTPGRGGRIKQTALDAMGLGRGGRDAREPFQSFASLPDTLKQGLVRDAPETASGPA